jgi:hypothetical protein
VDIGASKAFHRLATGGYVRLVAIRCQAVDSGASKAFHRLATGGYVPLEFA